MTSMSNDAAAPPDLSPSYDEFYYRHYDGGSYERSGHWPAFFGSLADEIVARLAPERTLDAGCAIGMLVEALADRGVDAHGIDVSEFAISQVPESLADRVRVGSLAEPLDGHYDLITSIEVIEHIEEPDLSTALDNLCNATDRLLISSTPYHYDDPTHVSIRQPEEWSREFARRGFVRDVSFDAGFISPWAVLYTRATKPWPEVIEDYDRRYWYDRREIHTTRQGIIALQDQVRSLEARAEEAADLVGAREEILRLRDELRAVLAEKGSAVGDLQRVTIELEAARYAASEAVIQRDLLQEHIDDIHASATWRIGRSALAPVRALRGRP
jgi:cyclopropane fatty-acyl-phospholipid synthase-like methyltransferase